MKHMHTFLFAIFSLILVGCGGGGSSGGDEPDPAAPVLTSIQITGAETNYEIGAQGTLAVTGTFNNGQSSTLSGVSWTSSDTAVASISASGAIVALAEGTTTITATRSGLTDTVSITVVAPSLTSIEITGANASYIVGTQGSLSVSGTFDNGQSSTITEVSWTSSDTDVASISASGAISALSEGTATITATSSGLTDTVSITVVAPSLTSIEITGADASYIVGTQGSLSVSGTFDNGQSSTISGITWASSNPAVASISANGAIVALTAGSTTFTSTINSLTDTVSVTVVPASLTSLEIVSSSSNIVLGSTLQLSARGTFNNGVTNTLADVVWSSASTSVATISDSGLLTSQSAGSALITAEKDGLSANFTVTVTAAELVSINVQISDSSTAVGTTTQAQAFGTFTDNSTVPVNVVWTSASPQVATINEQGLITGVSAGSSNISATSGAITSNSASVTITDAVVVGIDTSPGFSQIPIGLQEQLSATLLFSDNSSQTGVNVTWSSSDDAIASVATSNGVVTISALAAGSVEITAESMGFSSSFTITIVDAVAVSVAFDETSVSLPSGASQELSLIASFSDDSTSNVTNSSSFTVSNSALGAFAAPENGEVTFTSDSEGTGTLNAQFNSFTASIPLEVTSAVPVALVSATPIVQVAAGLSESLTVAVQYSDDTEIVPQSGVTWTVSDNAIASISASGTGIITVSGNQEGTVDVTAESNGFSFVFSVEVTAAEPVSLTFDVPTIYLDDDDVQLAAIMTYTDGSTSNVSAQVLWSSSNDAIATVSNNSANPGLIVPISEGEVSFTASFDNGSISFTNSTSILQPRLLKGFAVYTYNDTDSVVLGEGDYTVNIDFTELDGERVTLINDDNTGVAASGGAISFTSVNDADSLDYSASSIELTENSNSSIASINNANNVKALIQVHEVKSFGAGNSGNLVMFSWVIRTDGGDNFASYTTARQLKFFECSEPATATRAGSCIELGFSYSGSVSANETATPRPDNFSVASFILVALGDSFDITNLEASDTTNTVVPFFDGLTNQTIPEGNGASFQLFVPATDGDLVEAVFRFNVDNNTNRRFTLTASFRSN